VKQSFIRPIEIGGKVRLVSVQTTNVRRER
jgi:hypothetical protein